MLNYLLLSISCLIAFLSPVWGIGILLVLETSIFCLGYHYATVPLPIGYGGPMDVLIVVILIGAIYQTRLRGRSGYSRFSNSNEESLGAASLVGATPRPSGPSLKEPAEDVRIAYKRYRYGRSVLFSAILPYLLWLVFCGFLALMFGSLECGIKIAVRSMISNIIPWSLVAVVWLMRHRSHQILKIVIGVAICTALVHLAIQFLDLRSLMMRAYWIPGDPDLPISIYRQRKILEAEIVRGLPPGSGLMLYSLVFCFATSLIDRSREGVWFLAFCLLLALAFAITITRSTLALSVAGCFLAIVLGKILGLISPKVIRKIMARALIIGIFAMAFLVTQPHYRQNWIERLGHFSEDRRILSEETIRGANNLASIAAIKEQPFFGYGMNRYPERSSIINQECSDIHPLLEIGLFGGITAIVLIIRFHFVLFWRFWLACRRKRRLAARMLPYLSIFTLNLLVNSVGSGGSLDGRGLIPVALFAGLMAAEMARSETRSATN